MQKITRSRFQAVNEAGRVTGEDHHRAKLTDHEVWLMLELHDAGLGYGELALKFECSKSQARHICKGTRRAHTVTGQRGCT